MANCPRIVPAHAGGPSRTVIAESARRAVTCVGGELIVAHPKLPRVDLAIQLVLRDGCGVPEQPMISCIPTTRGGVLTSHSNRLPSRQSELDRHRGAVRPAAGRTTARCPRPEGQQSNPRAPSRAGRRSRIRVAPEPDRGLRRVTRARPLLNIATRGGLSHRVTADASLLETRKGDP